MISKKNNKTYIIAEIGVNHNGNLQKAKKLILAAKRSNADAVKFQSFDSNLLVTENAKLANYQRKNLKNNLSQRQMLKKLQLSFSQQIILNKFTH